MRGGGLYLKVFNPWRRGEDFHEMAGNGKTFERVYRDCTLEDFQPSFWKGLYYFRLLGRKCERDGAKSVYRYLDERLRNRPLERGRPYATQGEQLPSCTAKATMLWLHGRMDQQDYQAFRAEMTEKQFGDACRIALHPQVSALVQSICSRRRSDVASPAHKWQALLNEGVAVLERRRKKAGLVT